MLPQERNDRLNRVGFTLIEMLMVFLIIAILVGLLIPVVASARASAQRAAEISEMQLLATALQDFKTRYGVYPPSQFILREDGAYTAGAAPFIGPAATGQNTAVFDEDLSIQYIRRIWPQMLINTNGQPVNYTNNGSASDLDGSGNTANDPNDFYDWNGDGINNGPWYLQGDECLVFFLGGIPAGELSPGRGTGSRLNSGTPGTLGFSKNPRWPTQRIIGGTTSTSRDGPFFEFKGRLMDRDNDQFYELIPHRNAGQAPYAYFSNYDGSGYRPDDLNFTSEPNGDTMQSANFWVQWRITSGYPAPPRKGTGTPTDPYYIQSLGPNPYTLGGSYPNPPTPFPPGWITRYEKPDSFQLISPGSDLAYGPGGELPIPAGDPLRDGDRDNLATFFGGELKDMPR